MRRARWESGGGVYGARNALLRCVAEVPGPRRIAQAQPWRPREMASKLHSHDRPKDLRRQMGETPWIVQSLPTDACHELLGARLATPATCETHTEALWADIASTSIR